MTGSPARATRSGRRRLLLAGVVIVALLAVGYIGLTLLGTQADTTLRGSVEFGTGGSGCNSDGTASSFPSGVASIFAGAHLAREARAGEVVTFRVSRDGAELASVPRAFDLAGDCLGGALPGALLTPGHYRIEYLSGSETLAAGEFDVEP